MKVAILWTKLSGYMNVALRALVSHGCEILVINHTTTEDAPFDSRAFSWIQNHHELGASPEFSSVLATLEQFEPDVILSSWHVTLYQKLCARLKGRAIRVGCGDNQWNATFRQRAGRFLAPVCLHRYYDAFFMPGERQASWARMMGFREERIWQGLYVCDCEAFGGARHLRKPDGKAFLCVSRLSPEKGIRVLLEAYALYRQHCQGTPWSLIVAGEGSLREDVRNVNGVDWRCFVQPSALPSVYAEARCFVMPSLFEPWGVALHEAACAGLPVIATRSCGAAAHLIRDGYNGFVVNPNSAGELAEKMERMAHKTSEELSGMGLRSSELSKQFSPNRFASTVSERGNQLLAAMHRGGL